jgi:SAM-dependent methyltransferase
MRDRMESGGRVDATGWDERYADRPLVWPAEPNRFVAEHLSDLAPGRALDLAGGEGRNAVWLAARGWDVELVDFSEIALGKARNRAEAEGVAITCTLADVTADPNLDPADLVLLSYLQLEREAWRSASRLAAALVAPGGTLFIVAHAARNLAEGTGGPSEPEVLRSPDEVVADLAGTGLEIVTAGEVLRPVETEDGVRDAIDLLVRAERPR